MKYYDKPAYVIKKAFVEALAEEYAKSSYSNFMSFLEYSLRHKQIYYSFPSYISDSDMLEHTAEYNDYIEDSEKMNEALE